MDTFLVFLKQLKAVVAYYQYSHFLLIDLLKHNKKVSKRIILIN